MRFISSSIFLFLLFSFPIWAGEKIEEEISYNIGMVNASFAENQTSLTGKNITTPASGSVSSISGQISYKFAPGLSSSYYFNGTFPLLPNPQGTYFGAHIGSEFYFGTSSGSKVNYINSGTSIKLKPKNLYFWSLEGGLGYLVYETLTAKKSDLLLDIGANLGLLYSISAKWRLRATAGVARGTGVATTTIEIKPFLGLVFFID